MPNYENKDVNVIQLFKVAEAYHRSQPFQYIWHILGSLKHCARSHGLQATHQDKHKLQHHQSPFHRADLFIKYLTCISQGGFQVQESMYHTFTWSFNAAHSVSMSGCSSQSTWSIRITCMGSKCKSSVHEDLTWNMHIFLNLYAFFLFYHLHPLSFIILVKNGICILHSWSRSNNIRLQKVTSTGSSYLRIHTLPELLHKSSSSDK